MTHIIIHHTASPQNTPATVVNTWHEQRGFTKSSLGYYIGYHYLIGDDYFLQARKDNEVGCHTIGWNNKAIGVCLTGNFEYDTPLPYQKERLSNLLKELMKEHSIPQENILFHKDVAQTACPGKNITKEYIYSLIKDLKYMWDNALAEYKRKFSDPKVIPIIKQVNGTTRLDLLIKRPDGSIEEKQDVSANEWTQNAVGIWQ